VDVNIKVGELTGSGQPAMVVADFSQWIIETDNLTEIEVPDVEVGQTVTVTPDALPDLELTGTVESIKELFEEKRGDITYTVNISLDETDPRLRWGMTVVVTFEE
jgi:multidrug resistance efflux pump